jgi:hypothetical protein
MDGICQGDDANASIRRKKLRAQSWNLKMGKPSRILDVPGSYLEFDKHGKVLQGYLAQGAFEAMETYDALERSPGLRG